LFGDAHPQGFYPSEKQGGVSMVYAKRLAATTLLGVAAGIMCWQGGESIGIAYTPALIAGTILNRTFIGFTIGISGLRWPYFAHGVLIGVLGSLPMAVFATDARSGVMITMYGALWGVLIEVITSKALKAPMR
jgi:hypothetical protein